MEIQWKKQVKSSLGDDFKSVGPKGDTTVSTKQPKAPDIVKPTASPTHKAEGDKGGITFPSGKAPEPKAGGPNVVKAADEVVEELNISDITEIDEAPLQVLNSYISLVGILKLAKNEEGYNKRIAELEYTLKNLAVQAAEAIADSPEALLTDIEQKADEVSGIINTNASQAINKWMQMLRGKTPVKSRRQFWKAFKKALDEAKGSEKDAVLHIASLIPADILKAAYDKPELLLEKKAEESCEKEMTAEEKKKHEEEEEAKKKASHETTLLEKMSSMFESIMQRFAKDPNPAESKDPGTPGKLTYPTGPAKMPENGTPADKGHKEPGTTEKLILTPGKAKEPAIKEPVTTLSKGGEKNKASGDDGGTKKNPAQGTGEPKESASAETADTHKDAGEIAGPMHKQFSQIQWFVKKADAPIPAPTAPPAEGKAWKWDGTQWTQQDLPKPEQMPLAAAAAKETPEEALTKAASAETKETELDVDTKSKLTDIGSKIFG